MRNPRDGKIFHWLLKNGECTLGVGCRTVVKPRVRGICNSMLMKGKMLSVYNLGLEQAMKNLTSNHQEILIAVI